MSEDEQSFHAPDPAPGVTGNEPRAPLGGLVADVGMRIQEMLDTAERAAGEIRANAEAAGAAYLRDRQREAEELVQGRMAELDTITQSLAARAAGMEREATAFVAEVEQVRWRLARLTGEDAPQSGPTAPAPGNGGPQWPTPPASDPSQAAALRATQMAVAGAERSEIEHMLRDQFGMDDPSALDTVLGTDRV